MRWFTGNSYFKPLAFIAAILIYTLTACEKEVDLDLGDSAPAQLVVTLTKLGKFEEEKELVNRVLNWTIVNMESKKGYFYYQINKAFSSKIPYIRWAQAWMFYALSAYIKANKS